MSIVLWDKNRITQIPKALPPEPKPSFGKRAEKATIAKIPGYRKSKGGVIQSIGERLEARHQPTRLEQIIGKVAPKALEYEKFKRGYLPKGMPYAGEPLPRPTKSRLAGRAIDIPIDIAKAIPEMSGAYARSKFLPPTERLRRAGKVAGRVGGEIGTGILTSVAHPAASLREAPLETAGDAAIVLKGVQGLSTVGKMAGRAISKATVGRQAMNAQKQVQQILKQEGKVLGEQKMLVKKIKTPIDTRNMIRTTLEDVRTNGYGVFSAKDMRGLKEGLKKLGFKKSFTSNKDIDKLLKTIDRQMIASSAEEVLEGRDILNNKYISVKEGRPTSFGQKAQVNLKNAMNKSIDDSDKLAGTGGNWKIHNDKYAKTIDTAKRLRGLEDEITGYGKMQTYLSKIKRGDEGAINLWKRVDEITGGDVAERAISAGLRSSGMADIAQTRILGTTPFKPVIGATKLVRGGITRPTIAGIEKYARKLPTHGIGAAALPSATKALRLRQR